MPNNRLSILFFSRPGYFHRFSRTEQTPRTGAFRLHCGHGGGPEPQLPRRQNSSDAELIWLRPPKSINFHLDRFSGRWQSDRPAWN